jgi:hypothetical protein
MDPALQPSAPQNTLPTMPISSAKRSRENESPSQRHKREKAAERQRRKRERDRNAILQNGLAGMAAAQQQQQQHQQQQQQQQQPPPPPPPVIAAITHPQQPLNTAPPQSAIAPTSEPPFLPPPTELSPAELSRRERVRTAARERQRKHRALVKQKKLRELGLDMGNELGGVQELEDIQYRLAAAAAAADGAPFGALQHDLGQQPPHIPGQPDPAFTPGHNGGQTFASTLLLSFSCAPLLKQHILRTLSMTNEELASLEPIIAQAWDQWDHQVLSSFFLLPHPFPTQPLSPSIYQSNYSVGYTMHSRRKSRQAQENPPTATHSGALLHLPLRSQQPSNWAMPKQQDIPIPPQTQASNNSNNSNSGLHRHNLHRTISANASTAHSSHPPHSARSHHHHHPHPHLHSRVRLRTGSIHIWALLSSRPR